MTFKMLNRICGTLCVVCIVAGSILAFTMIWATFESEFWPGAGEFRCNYYWSYCRYWRPANSGVTAIFNFSARNASSHS